MSVEDIASQSNDVSEHDWKDPISGVHVSQGSVETLVTRGGITNHYSIAYLLSNISVKNSQNRLMCVEVIVCNVSVAFLRHSVHVAFPAAAHKTEILFLSVVITTFVSTGILSSGICATAYYAINRSLKLTTHCLIFKTTRYDSVKNISSITRIRFYFCFLVM